MTARRTSPLTAARPTVAAAWCTVLLAAALAMSHPLALAALLLAAAVVARRVGAGRGLLRVAPFAVPLLVVLVVVQVLLDRQGLTVLLRLGTLPVLGAVDVTLEAMVAAGVVALRLAVVLVVTGVVATAVDVDRLLLAAHRRWPAGALTAALAVRIAPVLVRDGARMAQARRCRPPGSPGAGDDAASRLLVLRAVTGSVLERAADLSATLELRGHGSPVPGRTRQARVGARAWSRHDLALSASALLVAVVVGVGALDGTLRLATAPTLDGPALAPLALASAALALLVVLPLRSRLGTAR